MKPGKLSFLDLALIIEIEDLLEYLHDNGHMVAVLNTFEEEVE